MSRGHHLYPRVVEEVVVERDHNRLASIITQGIHKILIKCPKLKSKKLVMEKDGKGSYKPYPSIQLA
jgi:hypothetical protein